jgi:hypothetical protein
MPRAKKKVQETVAAPEVQAVAIAPVQPEPKSYTAVVSFRCKESKRLYAAGEIVQASNKRLAELKAKNLIQ